MINKTDELDKALAALLVARTSLVRQIAASAASGGYGKAVVYAPQLNAVNTAIADIEFQKQSLKETKTAKKAE